MPADAQQISSAARAQLAPTGKLRVGINFGNALLAVKDAQGTPGGIAVDLARELAQRVGIPLQIEGYDSAGQMADAVNNDAWDAAFLSTDPDRQGEIAFTPPYVEIEATYLVPAESRLRSMDDVDRLNIRIAVSGKSAYDLFLTRTLKRAQLMRAPGPDPSAALFFSEKLDALAGLRAFLVEVADRHPGYRLLDGSFMNAQQAIGTPKARNIAAAYLAEFVMNIKASGFLKQTVDKYGIRGVTLPGK